MASLLLPVIYLAFISLGLPDALLGSAWPSMYTELGASLSWAGFVSMIISVGTIVSALIVGQIVNFVNRHFHAIDRIAALAQA